jgi:hypothetical protein
MPITLLKASSYYPAALASFYGADPALAVQPYAGQLDALMNECCGWSDAWRRHLEPTGAFRVVELVVNAEPLQKKWAEENGVTYRPGHWLEDIFFAQLERAAPDIVFAHAPEISLHHLERLRARNGGRRPFLIAYDGVARHDERLVRSCDLVLTCVQRTVEFYTSRKVRAWLFPYGFDSVVRERVGARPATPVDVSFIGSLAVRIGHQDRAKLLDEVSRHVPLDLWFASVPDGQEILRTQASFLCHREWREALAFPRCAVSVRRLKRLNRGRLFGLAMFAQLRASRISMNVHIAAAGGEAANMRLFEATGMGSCLVTDWKPNIAQLFEPDREVVVYRSAGEAVEKLRWLLANDAVRAEIAARGEQRTLQVHDTGARLRELGQYLREVAA